MNTILLDGFSNSERFLCGGVIGQVFPGAQFTGERYDGAVYNCTRGSLPLYDAVRRDAATGRPLVCLSGRMPDLYFLSMLRETAQQYENVKLFLCPENTADVAECTEAVQMGKRYESRQSLRMRTDSVQKLYDIKALSDNDRLILYGMLTGENAKSISDAVKTSVRYCESRCSVLRSRFAVLQNPMYTQASFSWLIPPEQT